MSNEFSIYLKKYLPLGSKYAPGVLLLFLSIFLSVYFRLGLVDLKATEEYAKNSIENEIYQQSVQEIDTQYPFLPSANKQDLIKKQISEFKILNKGEIDQEIAERALFFKSQYQDENDQTYLTGIDTDFYYRFVRNIIKRGHAGEYERDGKTFTKLMLAPTEKDVTSLERQFHVFATVWIYRLLHFFNRDLLPITLFFFMPAIFAGLAAIPAFFIGKEISNNIGGFVTATVIGLHGFILTRTYAGFVDTDIYNIFFPLVITYFAIKGFKAEKLWKEIIYTGATGLSIAFYSTAWVGWWNMFYYTFGAYCVAIAIEVVIYYKEYNKRRDTLQEITMIKTRLIHRIALLVSYLFFVSLFLVVFGEKISQIFSSLYSIVSFTGIKNATLTNLWPNILTTVAELKHTGIDEIISLIGSGFSLNGYLILIIAGLGILFIIISKEKWDYKICLVTLLILWTAATTYASFKGVRFVMLMIPPIAIAIGAFTGCLIQWISEFSKTHFETKRTLIKTISTITIVAFIIVPMAIQAYEYNKQTLPTLNDQWMETLQEIRDSSKETAIISSWWDFGHTFITYSERGASADGGSQNTPQAYWLGKMLVLSNERESVGILRMLNCDGNNAFEKINNVTIDPVITIKHINALTTKGKSEAIKYLLGQKFTADQITDIIKSTHGTPPESFVITSEDMIPKAPVWAHFGGWDFSKAEIWAAVSSGNTLKTKETVEKYDTENPTETIEQLKRFSEDQAEAWISGYPRYYSDLDDCTTSNMSVQCPNGVVIDRNENVKIFTKEATIKPGKIVVFDNGRYTTKEQESGVNTVAVLITQDSTTHKAMILSPELLNCTFTKLFILNNGGKYFKLFKDITDITGQRIITWTVDWEKVIAED